MGILELLKRGIVYLDGGMGTLLQDRGLRPGESPETWNLTHPEEVAAIHRAYFDAGSHVVCANTFGANPLRFEKDRLEQIVAAAMDNVRAARDSSAGTQEKFAALDIGPSGRLLKPYGDLDFEEGGTPVETDRMMLSSDPITLDILGSSLMGYAPEEIPYITIAAAYSGRGARLEDLEIIELNKPEKGSARPKGTAGKLALYTDPDEACSACYASLIHALKRLDDEGGLGKLKGRRIAVGQGWRGKSMDIGSGAC